MAKAKNGGNTPILAEMTKEQLLELAVNKGIAADEGLEAEGIIKLLTEADPSLAGAAAAGNDGDSSTVTEKKAPPQAEDDGYAVGTIRTVKGVEMVKVGGNEWAETIRENLEAGSPVKIISQKRAGKTIFAKSGKPITFDENGRATVCAADGQYLESIVIDGKPEYTVEG